MRRLCSTLGEREGPGTCIHRSISLLRWLLNVVTSFPMNCWQPGRRHAASRTSMAPVILHRCEYFKPLRRQCGYDLRKRAYPSVNHNGMRKPSKIHDVQKTSIQADSAFLQNIRREGQSTRGVGKQPGQVRSVDDASTREISLA
jgi:hypothetical protein